MQQSFQSPISSREVVVDEMGIRERRGGRQVAFVAWDRIQRLEATGVWSDSRKAIATRLPARAGYQFFMYASVEWARRFPERASANQLRVWREADRAAYLWIPAIVILSNAGMYVALWIAGFPESMNDLIQRAYRISIMSVVVLVSIVVLYKWLTRNRPNQALQTTSVTRSGFGKLSVSDRQRRGV